MEQAYIAIANIKMQLDDEVSPSAHVVKPNKHSTSCNCTHADSLELMALTVPFPCKRQALIHMTFDLDPRDL